MSLNKKVICLFGIFLIPNSLSASEFKELPFNCPDNSEKYIVPSKLDNTVSYYCFENIKKDTFEHICPYIMATKEGRIIIQASIPENGGECILSYYDTNGNLQYEKSWKDFGKKAHNKTLKGERQTAPPP